MVDGRALLLYGEARLTKDIDVTLGVGVDQLPRVMDTVRGIGLELLPEKPADFAARTMVLRAADRTSGIRHVERWLMEFRRGDR